jgi:MarR family 2-MHQ and catechol resistance regulon transcriptional repressor
MPTHYNGKQADTTRLNAFIKIQRGTIALNGCLQSWMASQDLTVGQFGVLETLYHLGPLKTGELGSKLLTSKPNLTAVLDNLERDKMVRRVRSPEDGRAFLIQLTPKGRKFIHKLFPSFVTYLKTMFSSLEAEELETLARLNKKMGLALYQRAKKAEKA